MSGINAVNFDNYKYADKYSLLKARHCLEIEPKVANFTDRGIDIRSNGKATLNKFLDSKKKLEVIQIQTSNLGGDNQAEATKEKNSNVAMHAGEGNYLHGLKAVCDHVDLVTNVLNCVKQENI